MGKCKGIMMGRLVGSGMSARGEHKRERIKPLLEQKISYIIFLVLQKESESL